MFAWAVAGVLVVWLIASLLAQFPFGARRIKGLWNYFLPHWSLFTAPVMYLNVKLCYREQIAPGMFSSWQPLPFPARPWFERLWQPERRLGKLVGDAAAKLVKLRLAGERSLAASTPPYRILCAYVRSNVPVRPGGPIQFAIQVENGLPEGMPKIIFQSDVHAC